MLRHSTQLVRQHMPPLLHLLRGLPCRTGPAAAWFVLLLRPRGLLLRCAGLGEPESLSKTLGLASLLGL